MQVPGLSLQAVKAAAVRQFGGVDGVVGFGIGDRTLRIYVRNAAVRGRLPTEFQGAPVEIVVTGDVQGSPGRLTGSGRTNMSDFIRVLAPDPHYKVIKSHMYIHRGIIVKVYPVYAEVVGNQAFRCTPDHPKAQIVSYTLVDQNGIEYSCGSEGELRKLGFEIKGEKKGKIGFIVGQNKEQEAIDSEDGVGEQVDDGQGLKR